MSSNIQKLIKSSGKKLTEISKETGILYPTLSGYNQGIRTPKKENAEILARYFNVSVPYLLGIDDNPQLRNPSDDSFFQDLYRRMNNGTLIDNKITEWTPFKEDLAYFISDFVNSEVLPNYIDYITKDKGYNPLFIEAFKTYIQDNQRFIYLINASGNESSPYYDVWQTWINSDEYKQAIKKK
jgi:DNA-binding protein